MKSILIVDKHKASVVMTSEVFKDKVPGCSVSVLGSGMECLEYFSEHKENIDVILVDFDLPDADGVSLIKLLKKEYNKPILLTAFDEPVVREAIDKDLFGYRDVARWLKKPLKSKDLTNVIQDFLLEEQPITIDYATEIDVAVIGRATGRGKRAPKVIGKLVNLNILGGLVNCQDDISVNIGQEVSLAVNFKKVKPIKNTSKRLVLNNKMSASAYNPIDDPDAMRISAVVNKTNKKSNELFLNFCKLSSKQKTLFEDLMRKSPALKL